MSATTFLNHGGLWSRTYMRITPIMGKGMTVSTMAKSIKVIMHFVFMVISKTHFLKDAPYLLTRKPSGQENCTLLCQRYGIYQEVARRTGLDRRTVKNYLQENMR
jgi:hypothetical protein